MLKSNYLRSRGLTCVRDAIAKGEQRGLLCSFQEDCTRLVVLPGRGAFVLFRVEFDDASLQSVSSGRCYSCMYFLLLLMVSSSFYLSHMFVTRVLSSLVFQSCPSLELVSPLQVTHLPPVWDLLLPLASPDRRDHRLLVSLPKDTGNVRRTKLPKFRNGGRWD